MALGVDDVIVNIILIKNKLVYCKLGTFELRHVGA